MRIHDNSPKVRATLYLPEDLLDVSTDCRDPRHPTNEHDPVELVGFDFGIAHRARGSAPSALEQGT